MELTMSDVGVRVIELRERSRRRRLPTVLGRQVKERAWPVRHLDFRMEGGEAVFILDAVNNKPGLFLRLSTGLLAPDEGSVTLPRRSILASTPKRPTVRSMSVGQALRFTAGCYGMSDSLIDRRFDEMVEFAEVGRLLHRPSESQPRHVLAQIGFAAAVCSPAELVAFDGSAVVGDKEFRDKCYAKLDQMRAAGKGIIVSSQDIRQIRRLADRGLVLEGSRSRDLDPSSFIDVVVSHKKGLLAKKLRRKQRRRADGDD